MSKVVYKYKLPIKDRFSLEMPRGASLLEAFEQNREPFLWAMVDKDEEAVLYDFRLADTGEEIETPLEWKHISTFDILNGAEIYHLFVKVNPTGTVIVEYA